MKLYLIRHAESANNARAEHLREEDPPISPQGQLQADHLARWMEALEPDVLITSPFLRTLQTTRPIIERNPQTVFVWHDVFERGGCYSGFGHSAVGAAGMGRAAIEGFFGECKCVVDDTIGEQGWWFGRNRETDSEAECRVDSLADRIVDQFGGSGKVVAIVMHADIKRLLLRRLLTQINVDSLGPLLNVGVTRLSLDGETWTLDWFNSVSHLPVNLIADRDGYAKP